MGINFIVDVWFKVNVTGLVIGAALFMLAASAKGMKDDDAKAWFIDKFGSVMSFDAISWFFYAIVWFIWL